MKEHDRQRPAEVRGPEQDSTSVGASQDAVLRGSKLSRVSREQGTDPGPTGPRSPKKDVPQSRLASILQGKRAIKRFQWPGSDEWCGIVVLTEEEIEECTIAAAQRLSDARHVMSAMDYEERFAQESAIQVLARCLVDPESGERFCLNADEVRRLVQADIITYCIERYRDHQNELSPLTSPSITEEEALAIVDALKKEQEEIDLRDFGAVDLRLLLTTSIAHSGD